MRKNEYSQKKYFFNSLTKLLTKSPIPILDYDNACLNQNYRKRTANYNSMSNDNKAKSRTDNSHATFLSCLRNWDDPYLHGYKPIKSVSCVRCEGCGCRIGAAYGQFESASENQLGQNHNEISSTCSSSSENSHCVKNSFGSNVNLNTDSPSRHYLCNTHSKMNRNLSVSSLNKKAASRAESSLHPSRFQPIVR